jgi:tRNA dimethylallyltransferase
METNMQLIAIFGPTASGKTRMALEHRDKIKERGKKVLLVNCDSRQIYQGTQISSGMGEAKKEGFNLVDFVNLKRVYTIKDFLLDFYSLDFTGVDTVILAGGTGLYMRAITDGYDIKTIKKRWGSEYKKEKEKLESLSVVELQRLCEGYDLNLNNSDFHNKRRLVTNALNRISTESGWYEQKKELLATFQTIKKIVTNYKEMDLKQNISDNVENRIACGMLDEIQGLVEKYGEHRIACLGLGYKIATDYFNKKIDLEACISQIIKSEQDYAKRQITWIKREKELDWNGNII